MHNTIMSILNSCLHCHSTIYRCLGFPTISFLDSPSVPSLFYSPIPQTFVSSTSCSLWLLLFSPVPTLSPLLTTMDFAPPPWLSESQGPFLLPLRFPDRNCLLSSCFLKGCINGTVNYIIK